MKKQKIEISRPFRLITFGLLALAMLAIPLPAFSQSCALCYTQAASAGARMIQALRSGILILIIPPTLGSIGMIFLVHHKRNQVRRTEYGDESGQDW
ncbi:MAG TPA: hypothetical protein VGU64_22195 [Terriglobales bacterium]|nr:hypothetical protein [Terriglobales bacterium]